MSIEELDLAKLEELAAAGASVTVPAALLLALIREVERLKEEVAQLKRNSSNSSKPPSSDRFAAKRPEKKGRGKAGRRRPGGQKGRAGRTLRQVQNPDRIVNHGLPCRCGRCHTSLRGLEARGFERRQVFDLPEKIVVEVTEHRAQIGICPKCGSRVKGAFPKEVSGPVQYGERIWALALYLQSYQLIPCERLSEFMADVFDCPVSPGTLSAMLKAAGARAGPAHEEIRTRLPREPFIHCDETGLSMAGKIHWLHTVSTPKLTYLHVDARRGESALRAIGILEGYEGFVIHDFLSSYYRVDDLLHGLCNAHHLRDLEWVGEDPAQTWAPKMAALLLEAKRLKQRERDGGRTIGPRTLDRLQNQYAAILIEGYAANPEPTRRPGQRGRIKRGKALNLLDRFLDRPGEVMAFLLHDVPFDNNQAERDLRMMKLKQKISGCFRSFAHAQAFVALRSIITTARKRSLNILAIIRETLSNPHGVHETLLGT